MEAENIEISPDEKIVVTKSKRQPTEKQLKALEKARNLKAIKKEAVKIVESRPRPVVKNDDELIEKIEPPSNQSFLMIAALAVTSVVAIFSLKQANLLNLPPFLSPTKLIVPEQQPMQAVIEKPVEEALSQEPMKKVKRCSNLVLEF